MLPGRRRKWSAARVLNRWEDRTTTRTGKDNTGALQSQSSPIRVPHLAHLFGSGHASVVEKSVADSKISGKTNFWPRFKYLSAASPGRGLISGILEDKQRSVDGKTKPSTSLKYKMCLNCSCDMLACRRGTNAMRRQYYLEGIISAYHTERICIFSS